MLKKQKVTGGIRVRDPLNLIPSKRHLQLLSSLEHKQSVFRQPEHILGPPYTAVPIHSGSLNKAHISESGELKCLEQND